MILLAGYGEKLWGITNIVPCKYQQCLGTSLRLSYGQAADQTKIESYLLPILYIYHTLCQSLTCPSGLGVWFALLLWASCHNRYQTAFDACPHLQSQCLEVYTQPLPISLKFRFRAVLTLGVVVTLTKNSGFPFHLSFHLLYGCHVKFLRICLQVSTCCLA